MESKNINWFGLSDSQKVIVLEKARIYLNQQIAEAKLNKSVMKTLEKHDLIE